MLREWALNLELPDALKQPRKRLHENEANMEESKATGWRLQDRVLMIAEPLDPAIPEAMIQTF